MNVLYSDNKMDLKLWCDNCIEFQVFEGAQDVFIRLTAVCCMFLPHNHYILSQHYKRHVCGPFCSCEHLYVWISLIVSISFVWIIWVLYATELSGQELEFVS